MDDIEETKENVQTMAGSCYVINQEDNEFPSCELDKMVDICYDMLEEYTRISVILVMKKLRINEEMAKKICCKVWLRQHLNGKKLARDIRR